MTKINKEVLSFIETIKKLRNSDQKEVRYVKDHYKEKIAEYILALSSKRRKALISDKYWIRYPMYTSWSAKDHPKPYGNLLAYAVSELCKHSKSGRECLVKHSVGILQAYTIESTSGSDRVRASNRGVLSKDSRVRKRSAKYISIHKAKSILREVDSSIKYILIDRIGPDNCHSLLVDDDCKWIRRQALSCSNISSEEAMGRLRNNLDMSGESAWHDYYKEQEAVILLDKVSDDDLLFFLDLSCGSINVEEYLKKRLVYLGYEAA
jgi:hypothetical protein